MAIIDILRSGVGIASTLLESLKLDVSHKAWIGQDGRGKNLYAAPVTRKAIVDLTKQMRYTGAGALVMTFATLTFLDAVADTTPNAGQTRENPIDPRDILTLPDGGTAPIVQTGAVADPATGEGLIQETILGTVMRGSQGQ